jgi:hypothetical protein
MANPCPCEVIVNESLSNNPPSTITDSTMNELIDNKLLEDDLDRLTIGSQLETSAEYYPLFQQGNLVQRHKRPSWAAVGKRALSLHNKRPSWAQVG